MKRKNNLYTNALDLNNIALAYNEVVKNTKNKRKVNLLKEYKAIYIYRTYKILESRNYVVGPSNTFTIYEPKKRKIVSQGIQDKIINHVVARFILYPALLPSLINENVASRRNMGTQKGLELYQKYRKICNAKYKKYYILKCDVSKFFCKH